ncbi:acyl-CoA dehydratase activase [Eubacterium sp.]|uniref:acyl-CoA dehydratase activase n=1 Tax=Eubacterium sp. TaxID=142586 RepID=UPI002FC909AC
MLTLGIDSGSTTTKGVLLNAAGEVTAYRLCATSARPRQTLEALYTELSGPQVACTVATGYGRRLLSAADKQVTEITCHALGCRYLAPNIGSVIDIGGQDSKAILLDRQGNVSDFLMNDKCAAGTGRFLDIMMGILDADIGELDAFVAGAAPATISSMCTVFAESEIIGLLAEEVPPRDIALGVIHSIAKRTAGFASRLPLGSPVFFSGGLSQSQVFCTVLQSELRLPVVTHPLGQFAGAIGAAVLGQTQI